MKALLAIKQLPLYQQNYLTGVITREQHDAVHEMILREKYPKMFAKTAEKK